MTYHASYMVSSLSYATLDPIYLHDIYVSYHFYPLPVLYFQQIYPTEPAYPFTGVHRTHFAVIFFKGLENNSH